LRPWRRLDPCGPPRPPVATTPAGAADRLANRLREPHGNLMAKLTSASTTRSCGCRSPLRSKAATRFPVILAVAAFALAGCNANQAVNPSSQPPSQVFAGHYVDTNPYNPISYVEQHRTRRPLKAGREDRRRRLSLNWRTRIADPDPRGVCVARPFRLQRQLGDQSLRTGDPLREPSHLQPLQSLELRPEQRRNRLLKSRYIAMDAPVDTAAVVAHLKTTQGLGSIDIPSAYPIGWTTRAPSSTSPGPAHRSRQAHRRRLDSSVRPRRSAEGLVSGLSGMKGEVRGKSAVGRIIKALIDNFRYSGWQATLRPVECRHCFNTATLPVHSSLTPLTDPATRTSSRICSIGVCGVLPKSTPGVSELAKLIKLTSPSSPFILRASVRAM
jgi:hypothetical protein